MDICSITKNGHREGADVVVLEFPTPPMDHIFINSLFEVLTVHTITKKKKKKNRSLNYIFTINIAN